MAKKTKTDAAPSTAAPKAFFGFPLAAQLGALALLLVPAALYVLDLANPQLCGVFFAVAFLLCCIGFAIWPVAETSETRAHVAILAVVAVLGAAAGGFPLLRSLYPGQPAASFSLTKDGGEKPIGVKAGPYDVVVHADFSTAAGHEVRADYIVRVAAGSLGRDIEGRFESQRTRGRVGRTSVSSVKAPREWNRHAVLVPEGEAKISLLKADTSLAEGVEVQLYPHLPFWPFVATAGVLALVAAAVGSILPNRRIRHGYVAGVLAAISGGVLGSTWAWMGEPLLPLVGATFVGIVGAYLLTRMLMPAMRALPFANRS